MGMPWALSIVSRIVNLLGHKLEVRSELGKRSTFSLELPRGRTAQVHPGRRTVPHDNSAERATLPHILLAEDDAGVRKAVRARFSSSKDFV